MKKIILILSNPQDAHIPYVTKHLAAEEVVRMDPSDIIKGETFDFVFDTSGVKTLYKGKPVSAVKSVWLRRPTPLEEAELPVKYQHLQYARSAIGRHAQMLVSAFPDALWVSDAGRIFAADDKLLQLQTAAKLGLNVPETLFASSGKQAKNFVAKHGVCIAKTQASRFPPGLQTFTRIVRDSDNLDYQNLNLDPYTFQQYIQPAYELRVTVVGDKVFTAKVEGEDINSFKHRDWRYAHVNDTFNAKRARLPAEVAQACRELVKELGLLFGAIDLIVDKQKKIWFLEINPNGQWAFVEQFTSQPIGKALASLLKR